MTEIEIYKETIKVIHNEYIRELEHLKSLLVIAVENDDVRLEIFDNTKETILANIKATIDTSMAALNLKCDSLLASIECEMRKK